MSRHGLELELPPEAAAERLAEAAESVGGEWSATPGGGRLTLPVVYGLRRGHVVAQVELSPASGEGTHLAWSLEESHLVVERSSVVVLSIAVVPLVVTIAWPFWPALFPLVPIAAIFGLVAWWLVVSRLRTHGPEEFFAGFAAPPAASSDRSSERESDTRVVR